MHDSRTKLWILAAAVLLIAAPTARAQDDEKPADPDAKQEARVYALMTTSKGEILLELNREKAPKTVENFLSYVDGRFYDGTIFHRVIDNFMIQGGGFMPDYQRKPTQEPVVNEWQNGLKNARGTISMARIGGRPDSGTSQFFINVVDNTSLDEPQPDGAAYAVFGRVVDGMKVVDEIRAVETKVVGPHRNAPAEAIVIETVRRMTAEDAMKRMKDDETGDDGVDE